MKLPSKRSMICEIYSFLFLPVYENYMDLLPDKLLRRIGMYVNEMPLRFSASVTSSVMTFLSHLDVGWVKRCACIKWIILVLRSGGVLYACVFLEIQTRCSRYHHNCRTIFFFQRFIIQMNAELCVQLIHLSFQQLLPQLPDPWFLSHHFFSIKLKHQQLDYLVGYKSGLQD